MTDGRASMIPETLIVDLSGPQRIKAVRLIDGTAYAERNGQVVAVAQVAGEPEAVKPGKRWTVGEWTVERNTGCSCGGRNRLLRAFTP